MKVTATLMTYIASVTAVVEGPKALFRALHTFSCPLWRAFYTSCIYLDASPLRSALCDDAYTQIPTVHCPQLITNVL